MIEITFKREQLYQSTKIFACRKMSSQLLVTGLVCSRKICGFVSSFFFLTFVKKLIIIRFLFVFLQQEYLPSRQKLKITKAESLNFGRICQKTERINLKYKFNVLNCFLKVKKLLFKKVKLIYCRSTSPEPSKLLLISS